MPPEEPDFFVICARSGRFAFTSRFFHYPFPARSDPNFGSGGTSPPGAIRQLRLAPVLRELAREECDSPRMNRIGKPMEFSQWLLVVI